MAKMAPVTWQVGRHAVPARWRYQHKEGRQATCTKQGERTSDDDTAKRQDTSIAEHGEGAVNGGVTTSAR